MKKASGIIWGLILVAVGVIFGLNACGITNINIFFDGWWTLFIIVPCAVGLVTERDKGNIIGLAVGVFLLLCCQDVLSFELFRKLLIPAVIVCIGLSLIFGSFFKGKAERILLRTKGSSENLRSYCATFSGDNVNFDGEFFDGADITAVFGGFKCDLRRAVIDKDVVIKVSAIFGGIDIFVPENVNVKTGTTSIFGGVSNKTSIKPNVPTIYVSGYCLFGGVDIK